LHMQIIHIFLFLLVLIGLNLLELLWKIQFLGVQ
jgi:hypothetical protein